MWMRRDNCTDRWLTAGAVRHPSRWVNELKSMGDGKWASFPFGSFWKEGGLCVEFGLTRESLDDEEGQRDKASISRSAGMSSSIGC
jgi:hypothetical protein